MSGILFVNACVRRGSRTERLAEKVLECLGGGYEEVRLSEEKLLPLDGASLENREEKRRSGLLDDPVFTHAKQFADAETVVIAAPYWDLSFPSALKVYCEAISVSGITFTYEDDRPKGLCRAHRVIYVTTSGGMLGENLGYVYIRALCGTLFGIPEVSFFAAEGLDMIGIDTEKILAGAEQRITDALRSSVHGK